MAGRFLANDWLDFRLLELDDVPAAAQFGFRYGGVYSYLQSGFDPAYARYSPGWVLGEMILRDAISAGLREYDFLGGEDSYKLRWGAEQRRYAYLTCVRPNSGGAALHRMELAGQRAVAAARSLTPRPIWATARAVYRALRGQDDE